MPARNTLTWGFGAGVLYVPEHKDANCVLSRLGFPLDMAALEDLVVALLAHCLAMGIYPRSETLTLKPVPFDVQARWYHSPSRLLLLPALVSLTPRPLLK